MTNQKSTPTFITCARPLEKLSCDNHLLRRQPHLEQESILTCDRSFQHENKSTKMETRTIQSWTLDSLIRLFGRWKGGSSIAFADTKPAAPATLPTSDYLPRTDDTNAKMRHGNGTVG